MKWIIVISAWLLGAGAVLGQTIPELKKQLEEAESSEDKMRFSYELGNTLRNTDNPDEALEYARRAHDLARDLKNKGMTARSAYLLGLVYERKRDERNEEVWLRAATDYAKQAGDADLIVRSVEKRGSLALRERKTQRAIDIYRDAFEFFSQSGSSISDLEQQYAMQKKLLEREKLELQAEREQLQQDVLALIQERDRLTSRQTELVARQRDLIDEKQEVEKEVGRKAVALDSLSVQKRRAENIAQEARELAKTKEEEYNLLSKEALQQKLALEETRAKYAEAELAAERNRNILMLAGLALVSLIILSLLTYGRFRASRRAKRTLEEKNRIIDTERQRSEELLLNILPASIATELKTHGKARARRYEEVTVLFADFKNFTQISERLSPEELVQELDKCFKAFDFIISQYEDIEKIKTIGDAYMCASGLSERKSLPTSLVRAALEMQQFLEEHKVENMRLGKPYFEARVGLHTGPVVAGVVGVNKFSYDIWGDTVNTASRVEANCEEGRVNISETTYRLVKYQFECEYRGKVEAKNKGAIDMYFVNKQATAVAV